jgi:hypothetical protein
LFSITCALFFCSLQKSDTPSRFFSITSTLFARVPGFAPPPHQNTPTRQPRLGQRRVAGRSAPTDRSQRTGSGRCSLFAMSLFRHIVTSSLHPEKPYAAPHHLTAKRYRTLEEVYTSSCREAKSCNPLLQSF